MLKNKFLLFLFIFFGNIIYAQSLISLSLNDGNSLKKEMKYYKKRYGESYIDSMYYCQGYLSIYKKEQSSIFDIGFNIVELYLSGYSRKDRYPQKTALRDKNKIPYKIPLSVRKFELYDIAFPPFFDLSANTSSLKELLLHGFAVKKDTLLLDYLNFDSLMFFTLIYSEDLEPPYIKLSLPPNLKMFQSNIPALYMDNLPNTLEQLIIQRDSIYPFFKSPLSNLWYLSIGGNEQHTLPEELVDKSSIKNIAIRDTLIYKDIELLSKISHLDTLTLTWNKKIDLPDNLKKLTNVSVVKLDYYTNEMYRQKFSIASELQNILPNVIILYKDILQNQPRIEGFIEYKQKEK